MSEHVRAIQAALSAAGFDVGPADGRIGPRTIWAVTRAIEKGIMMIDEAAIHRKKPSPDGPPWLVIARSFIGEQEIAGPVHNRTIVGWWNDIHSAWFVDDETPWCAAYVGAMLEKAGVVSSRSAAARSYETWGQNLPSEALGCVAVFSRSGGGHVGFVVGRNAAGDLMILGGNQSNAVNIKPISRSRLIGFRWPTHVPLPALGVPLLSSSGELSTNEA